MVHSLASFFLIRLPSFRVAKCMIDLCTHSGSVLTEYETIYERSVGDIQALVLQTWPFRLLRLDFYFNSLLVFQPRTRESSDFHIKFYL